jgi:transposase
MSSPSQTQATLAQRRFLAVRRVAEGLPPTQVAEVLGVHVETVRLWVRTHKAGGDAALSGTPHPGRKPFLTPDQDAQVRSWLTQSPTAFGFLTELWTAARVAQLIHDRLGVGYHPNYLREWLSARGYSPQKPKRRARQQKPEHVHEFLTATYPAVQKKSPRSTPISS